MIKNNINKYKDYFKKTFFINENEEEYIIELTYDETSCDYEKNIFNKYYNNYKLLKKYDPNIKRVENFKELISLINNKKNNIYILFDNNLNENIKYYLVIWDEIHTIHNIN